MKVNRNKEIDIQQNLAFFLKQSHKISFDKTQYKTLVTNNLKLLTQKEKQWLNHEIDDFQRSKYDYTKVF